MTLDLQATPAEVMRAVETLEEFARLEQVPEPMIFGLMLALEECASNIVNHAYGRDPQQKFQVTLERNVDSFTIELRDRGPAFDPSTIPVRTAQADDDDPGGWGIELVRRNTDQMRYAREAGANVLRLTRKVGTSKKPTNPQTVIKLSKPRTKENIMPLEMKIQKDVAPSDAGGATVKLAGSLDTMTAPELEKQLADLLKQEIKLTDIVFDLAQLKFISSAGLRVFGNIRKQLKERNGQAVFVHLQPQIQEVFDIIRSLPGVAIFKNVAELDKYLSARQRSHMER